MVLWEIYVKISDKFKNNFMFYFKYYFILHVRHLHGNIDW